MFRRLFLSRYVPLVSVALAVCSGILYCVAGSRVSEPGWFTVYDYFDIALKLLLTVFLFYSYEKHNLLGVQAGACGLLVEMVCDSGSYTLAGLLGNTPEYFIVAGFWGSFFLACNLMLFILEVILLINHFVIFVLKKSSFLRVSVNQATLLILFFFLLFEVFIVSQLPTEPAMTVLAVASALLGTAVYALVASAELLLVLDGDERA